jgi:methylglutamate dehydrogenase subunit D
MLKRSSALASAKSFSGKGLSISEAPNFTLAQYAGAEKELKKALGKIPARVGVALDGLLRLSPNQILVILHSDRHSRAVGNDGVEGVYVTQLSSSRTRIALEGENARAVLAKLVAIDFHAKQFKADMFVQTSIHHTPALIHCVEKNSFHIYAMRTFALSVWDAVTDAALEFSA